MTCKFCEKTIDYDTCHGWSHREVCFAGERHTPEPAQGEMEPARKNFFAAAEREAYIADLQQALRERDEHIKALERYIDHFHQER